MDKEGSTLVAERSTLIRNLGKEIARNRWLLVHKQDKDFVEKMVPEPAEDLECDRCDFYEELLELGATGASLHFV